MTRDEELRTRMAADARNIEWCEHAAINEQTLHEVVSDCAVRLVDTELEATSKANASQAWFNLKRAVDLLRSRGGAR